MKVTIQWSQAKLIKIYNFQFIQILFLCISSQLNWVLTKKKRHFHPEASINQCGSNKRKKKNAGRIECGVALVATGGLRALNPGIALLFFVVV